MIFTVDVTGNGPWTIDFTLDGVPTSVSDTNTTINLGNASGVYVLTNVSDSGCVNTAIGNDSIIINDNPTVVSMTGGNSYCGGVPIDDIMIETTGTGPWTIDFTVDGTPQSVTSAISPFSIGNTEGVYVLVNIADANCNDAAVGTQSIIITTAPNVYAGADFINCENDAVTLSATGALTYVWDNGITDNVSFIPTSTLTYTVIGTDVNGCSNTDDITVTYEALPIVSFVADSMSGCEPMFVNFTNTTPGNMAICEWEFGDGNTFNGCADAQNMYENGGNYTVTLTTTSVNGCVNSAVYNDYIYVENIPVASYVPSLYSLISLNTLVDFTNMSSGGAVTYIWDFDDGSDFSTVMNPSHVFPEESAGYEVMLYAISPIGCVDSVTHVITVTEEIIYYVPNTFTPDGDEFNNTFQPIFTAGYDPYNFHMTIFNRWGQAVFETFDDKQGWDGTF